MGDLQKSKAAYEVLLRPMLALKRLFEPADKHAGCAKEQSPNNTHIYAIRLLRAVEGAAELKAFIFGLTL